MTWIALDATSGVASTEFSYKGPGGTWGNTGLDAQTGTSGTFSYTPTGGEEAEEGTYYFATRSTDNAGNVEEEPSGEGDISYTITAPEPTPACEGDGGCFIATSAFWLEPSTFRPTLQAELTYLKKTHAIPSL